MLAKAKRWRSGLQRTEAREICRDADLRSDLRALTSDGIPICAEDTTLSPRPATQEEIAARAYELYLERGQLPGYEEQDWLEAEKQLTAKSGR